MLLRAKFSFRTAPSNRTPSDSEVLNRTQFFETISVKCLLEVSWANVIRTLRGDEAIKRLPLYSHFLDSKSIARIPPNTRSF